MNRFAGLCAGALWLLAVPAFAYPHAATAAPDGVRLQEAEPLAPARDGGAVHAAGAAAPRSRVYRCGAGRVRARFDGEAVMLRIEDRPAQRLLQVRSASGARFAAAGLVFHDRGREALLIQDGAATTCERLDPGPWQARGQEPGWRATLDGSRMVLELDNGAQRIVVPQPAPEERGGGMDYAVRTEAHAIVLAVRPAICHDPMSGVPPYPDTVQLRLDGRVLDGCGGDPAALLQGPAWVVERIDGKPAAGERPTTITFDEIGRVYGQGPCNAFTGGYSIGEGIVFTPIASTMRMCAPAAMESEAALHTLLQGAVPFAITADGALQIGAGPGALVARRGAAAPE